MTVYRYVAFNVPRFTTAVGVVLLLGTAAVHLYLIGAARNLPVYLVVYFAVLGAACVVAAAMMITGRFAERGWVLASLVSAVFLVVYVVTRFTGLPKLPEVKNWWDFVPGTVALGCAVLFLTVHASVSLGINVAHPRKRDWHD